MGPKQTLTENIFHSMAMPAVSLQKKIEIAFEIVGAQGTEIGNANLFTKCLFTILVPLNPPPPPKQQSDGSPIEFMLKGPQTELRTLSQNCEQTLRKWQTEL